MIRALRLDMRVVLVSSEFAIHEHRIVLPAGLPVSLTPLRRKWIEDNAIHCHAERLHHESCRFGRGLWLRWNAESVVLWRDPVGIIPIWKSPGLVIGKAVRANES